MKFLVRGRSRGHLSSQVATGLAHNAGHNCIKAEVVVTAAEWPLREQFLDALRHCSRPICSPACQCPVCKPHLLLSLRMNAGAEQMLPTD